MTRILRRCPYSDTPTQVILGSESIPVRPHQIIVWMSVTFRETLEFDQQTPRFPAILDIGHSHNFSIQEDHLVRWAGISPRSLPVLGQIRELDRRAALGGAGLWLHRNRAGERDALCGLPMRLEIARGIAIYPTGSPFPRLPLLGLRPITTNRIIVTIDGQRREVSARTRRWWFW